MKSIFLSLSLLFCSQIMAQNYATWTTSVKNLGANEFEIALTAKIEKGWHIFALENHKDGIGLPTRFTFKPTDAYQLVGTLQAPAYTVHEEKDLGFVDWYYEKEVTFKQRIKTDGSATTIPVHVDYQICKEVCLQQQHDFSISTDVQ